MNPCLLPTYLRGSAHTWRSGHLDRAALEAQAQQLMASPHFDAQRRHFAQAKLGTFSRNWVLDRVMRDDGRFAMLAFLLYLHHHAQHTGGITYSGLLALFAHGSSLPGGALASPTRIKALLGIARMMGHLVQGPSPRNSKGSEDQRLRVWLPTQKLLEPGEVWLRDCILGLGNTLPLAASGENLMRMPGMLPEVLSYNVLAYLHDGFILHESFSGVRRFMQRDGGYLVLMQLLHTMQRSPENGPWRANAQPHQLSQRFRVASGTVRNALRDAAAHGWLVQLNRGGHDWQLCDDFAAQGQRWAAYEMLWMAGNVNAAYLRLTAASGSTQS
jgi:hypothetical protein